MNVLACRGFVCLPLAKKTFPTVPKKLEKKAGKLLCSFSKAPKKFYSTIEEQNKTNQPFKFKEENISPELRAYVYLKEITSNEFDRRFKTVNDSIKELKEDNERRFKEVKEDNERRFNEVDRRFNLNDNSIKELKEGNERRFNLTDNSIKELKEDTKTGFKEAKEETKVGFDLIDNSIKELKEDNERRFKESEKNHDRSFRILLFALCLFAALSEKDNIKQLAGSTALLKG